MSIHHLFAELIVETEMYVDGANGQLCLKKVPPGMYELVPHDVNEFHPLLGLGRLDPLRTAWLVIRGTKIGGPRAMVRDWFNGDLRTASEQRVRELFAGIVRDLEVKEAELDHELKTAQDVARLRALQHDVANLYVQAALLGRGPVVDAASDARPFTELCLVYACLAYQAADEPDAARDTLFQYALLKGVDRMDCARWFDGLDRQVWEQVFALLGKPIMSRALNRVYMSTQERPRLLTAPLCVAV